METTHPAITATALSRTYGYREDAVRAVRGVDLAVATRSLTVLVGPSGAGTSTLLQCLAGTDREITGRVVRHGALLPSGSPGARTRLRRARVASVGAVEEPAPPRAGSTAVQLAWDAEVLGALGPAGAWDEISPSLAAALRRLVGALVQRPDVLVADEPTADLDAGSANAVVEALRAVVDRLGVTVVVATHDPRLAERADRVLAMEDGRIVADSAPGARVPVLTAPQAAAPERRLELARS